MDAFGFFSNFLKVTEVTTEQQNRPKISENSIKSQGRGPKPSAGARSKPA